MQNNIVSVPKRRPRTKRIELGMLALAVFLLIVPVPQVRGQAVANAQISGVVQDPSGAAVPGARVTGTQSKYPPAKPGALVCEPLKAAAGSLTRPRKTTGNRDVLTCRGALLNLPGHFPCYTLWEFAMFLETPM